MCRIVRSPIGIVSTNDDRASFVFVDNTSIGGGIARLELVTLIIIIFVLAGRVGDKGNLNTRWRTRHELSYQQLCDENMCCAWPDERNIGARNY